MPEDTLYIGNSSANLYEREWTWKGSHQRQRGKFCIFLPFLIQFVQIILTLFQSKVTAVKFSEKCDLALVS